MEGFERARGEGTLGGLLCPLIPEARAAPSRHRGVGQGMELGKPDATCDAK